VIDSAADVDHGTVRTVSVLEDLKAFEQRVVDRLEELRPLVEEYEELRRIAKRLDLQIDADRPPTASSAPSPRPPAGRAGKRRSASRRRAGGTQATGRERRERVLALVGQRPGITVPDLSRELGVDAPSLYRVVRKLVSDGVIVKEGKQLRSA